MNELIYLSKKITMYNNIIIDYPLVANGYIDSFRARIRRLQALIDYLIGK